MYDIKLDNVCIFINFFKSIQKVSKYLYMCVCSHTHAHGVHIGLEYYFYIITWPLSSKIS